MKGLDFTVYNQELMKSYEIMEDLLSDNDSKKIILTRKQARHIHETLVSTLELIYSADININIGGQENG